MKQDTRIALLIPDIAFLSLKIPRKDGSGTDNKAPYSYGYFHFVFATGAMYFAMLFIGWNPHRIMHKYGSSHKFERTLLLDITVTSMMHPIFLCLPLT